MVTKPDIVMEHEVRATLANGINYTIQQTGISMLRLAPIIKELYLEIQAQAEQEYQEIKAKYEKEVKNATSQGET